MTKYGGRIPVSREILLAAGALDPTPEERAEQDRRAADYSRQRAEHAALLDAARQALAALTDPLARAVLDLHHEKGTYRESGYPWPTCDGCDGCDMDGYEAEPPEWPCRTVTVVARHYGIDLPE